MYVIYKEWEEKDYGYGGWKDTFTKYFEIIGVVESEDIASDVVKQLEEKDSEAYYDYKVATKLD